MSEFKQIVAAGGPRCYVAFVRDRTLLIYYLEEPGTHRRSSRFRPVPVGWLYAAR